MGRYGPRTEAVGFGPSGMVLVVILQDGTPLQFDLGNSHQPAAVP
jgi:hypothetical protein